MLVLARKIIIKPSQETWANIQDLQSGTSEMNLQIQEISSKCSNMELRSRETQGLPYQAMANEMKKKTL